MIRFQDIKIGDYVIADFAGSRRPGEVTELNRSEKQVCVDIGIQEFWYDTDHLIPIPLDEGQLLKLNFRRKQNEDGSVKYMKGAFRILLPEKDNFSKIEIWYREEKRIIGRLISVHQLQNHLK
jgi:hypothetical protein